MNKLAFYHFEKQFSKFWKGTKKLIKKISLPISINGITKPSEIANLSGAF